MADYRKLVIHLITADGKIDGSEIKMLKKSLYEDGKISTEEVTFLADLRTALLKKAKKSSTKFDAFFLKSLHANILDDGTISSEEVGLIRTLVVGDKTFKNGAKKKFLDGLKEKATSIAPEFEGLYGEIKK